MRILASLSIWLAFTVPVQAASVEYQFTARVNDIFEHNGSTRQNTTVTASSMPGSHFQVGDLWTGTFSYDPNMALNQGYQPAQPANGTYLLYKGVMSINITNASTGFTFNSSSALDWLALMQVKNSSPGTGSDLLHFSTYASGTNFESGHVTFSDWTGTTLSAPTPPTELNFQHPGTIRYDFLQRAHNSQMHASAQMMSFNLVPASPVPEPSSIAMLGLGLASVAVVRRRMARS